jgi:DNA-binding MarR family transcriptional regulator
LSGVKDNRTFPTMSTTSTQTAAPAANGERAVERSMNAVRSVVRALRINTRAIESQMGISLAQLFVLQQLADRPANSLNDLAERTATHQSSVSVVVRRLVDNGYVSRTTSAHDKRRIEIDVTPSGRDLLAGAPSTIQLQLMASLRRMSARDQTTLADLLERWLRDAKIDIASPPMLGEDDSNGDPSVS